MTSLQVLAFGRIVTAAFIDRLFAMCRRNGWTLDHANWLMGCMGFESGYTFSPSVRNAAGSGATGLIQFMPATALGLFYSASQIKAMTAKEKKDKGIECCNRLAKMSAVEQLAYVEDYFKPYSRRIASFEDMYMAILMPSYIGRPNETVLFSDGTTAYRQNSGLDKNSDGIITKAEAAAKARRALELGMTGKYVLTGVPSIS